MFTPIKKSKIRQNRVTRKHTYQNLGNINGGNTNTCDPTVNSTIFIFPSTKISTQPNTDSSYKEIGIIHITESAAINFIRDSTTEFMNLFGSAGFDNTIYDKCRNKALFKLNCHIKNGQKVCNMRMEIDSEKSLLFVHIYGTLLETASNKLA